MRRARVNPWWVPSPRAAVCLDGAHAHHNEGDSTIKHALVGIGFAILTVSGELQRLRQ